jgi:ABC-2 type transport system permease protein
VLAGRTMSGLLVGWRIEHGVGDALLAAGLSLLFAFGMTWVGACAGMVLRSPESAQALGFVLFLPLSFVSNAFVPTQGMPAWLRDFANWNPMSAVAATCRKLSGGSVPTPDAWPMQHPELAVVLWSVGLVAIFAPLAVALYRRKVLR